jgi:hypothetical protein
MEAVKKKEKAERRKEIRNIGAVKLLQGNYRIPSALKFAKAIPARPSGKDMLATR